MLCDAFHMWEKQSDTFAEQRRHFISTAPAARLVRSRLRGRLIDGVPFRSSPPLRGRVISAPVSLFFSTGARPSERSTYRRKNPPSLPFNCGFFHLCRLSSFSDDPRMNSYLYTIHLSCQQSRKTFSLSTSEQGTNLYLRLVGISRGHITQKF